MSTRMVVVADDQESAAFSLEKAKYVAEPLSANVEAIQFVAGEIDDSARQTATSNFDDLVDSVFDDLKPVSSQIVPTDNVAQWIVNYCNEGKADIVLKTGHRSETLFHKPTDWELIRSVNCPVFIASNQKWKSKPNVLVTISLPSDDLEHLHRNQSELVWGQRWAEVTGSKLHVVYSLPIPGVLLGLDMVERRDWERQRKPEAQRNLDSLLEKLEISDVVTHVTAGPPQKTIPRLANELKADLVIMGCVGRDGIRALLHGNLAEKVLHHLRTDILVVKASMDHH